MILDTINHASRYAGLNEGIDQVLRAMADISSDNFPTESILLDGEAVRLNFFSYLTHSPEVVPCESHVTHIDVMYLADGCETIYVKPAEALSHVTKPYDPQADIMMADLDPDAVPVRVPKGSFIILFPQESHAPGCFADGKAENVKKVVGKILIKEDPS